MKSGIFLIDEAKRKKFALWGIIVNLMFLHIWASLLIVKVLFAPTLDANTASTMQAWFTSIMTAISVSLLILISDKAIDWVIAKFSPSAGTPPAQVTETITRTVQNAPAVPATSADTIVNDVNMKVEGNVNVQQP